MIMKHKALFFAAVSAMAAVACSTNPKVSETTEIKGSFTGTPSSTIEVRIPSIGYDTVVNVTDGRFNVSVPTAKTTMSLITADNVSGHFIADGTPLTVVFDSINVNITSKYPELSSNTFYNDYKKANKALEEEFNKEYASVANDEEAAEALYDKFQAKADSLNKAYLDKKDNSIVTLMALQNLQYSLPAEKMDSIINTLDTTLASMEPVARMRKTAKSQMATAEGKMFTDFEVDGVKLSDYVGKGKYILVDFWAPWCGPCKREIPNIKNVYDKYHGSDFDVLSVEVWPRGDLNAADTAKAYGVNWNQMMNAKSIPTDIYGIQGIPHIILFGPDGTILKRDLRGEDIEKAVAGYVQANK